MRTKVVIIPEVGDYVRMLVDDVGCSCGSIYEVLEVNENDLEVCPVMVRNDDGELIWLFEGNFEYVTG